METLIGKKAPLFKANAVINGNDFTEDVSLVQFIGRKEVIFFFDPLHDDIGVSKGIVLSPLEKDAIARLAEQVRYRK